MTAGIEAVKQVGRAIDAAATRLPLWKRDRATALYYLLTVFEDRIRLPLLRGFPAGDSALILNSDQFRQSYEHALTPLIKIAYERCPAPSEVIPSDELDPRMYGETREALDFGVDYDLAVSILESALNGKLDLVVDGFDVRVHPIVQAGDDYDAQVKVAAALSETDRPHPLVPIELYLTPPGQRRLRKLAPLVQARSDGFIKWTVPEDVDRDFARLAVEATSDVDHPLEALVGRYTVDDFRAFFRHLYKLAALNQTFCWVAGLNGITGAGVGSLVLELSRDALEAELVGTGRMPDDTFRAIIADLTYDPQLKNTDVYFQPLLEIAPGRFLLSPLVLTASNWERNLLRLWALKYGSQYAAQVHRTRAHLADTVAAWFAHPPMRAVANRVLTYKGRALTDVDIAVYDPRDDALLLFQVKWVTGPAEPREVRDADEELDHGLAQARLAERFVREHPEEAGRQLFRDSVQLTSTTRVRSVLLARGYPGSADLATQDVPILYYPLIQRHFQAAPSGTLLSITEDLCSLLALAQRGKDYEIRPASFELAGYRFHSWAAELVPGHLLPGPP